MNAVIVLHPQQPGTAGVHIGLKWRPNPATLLCTDTGAFWQRMPPIEGAALSMQRAFLLPVPPSVLRRMQAIQQLRKNP